MQKALSGCLADKITPHIDICRTSNGKVWFDYFSDKGNSAKTSIGSKYANDFFIYTLEWTSDKLVWKINDTVGIHSDIRCAAGTNVCSSCRWSG